MARLVFELLFQREGNDACADCGSLDPHWISYSHSVLICKNCAELHQRLMPTCRQEHISPDMTWDTRQIEKWGECCNRTVNKVLEAMVPHCYRRPTSTDPLVVREQWILSKYVSREFVSGRCTDTIESRYQQKYKEGFLWKRGKKKDTYQRRLFVLDGNDNALRYYINVDDAEPKCSLSIDDLNLMVVPDKLGNINGMQIVCQADKNSTRNIFVYAECGKELIEWYSCFRHMRLMRLQQSQHCNSSHELCAQLTHDFVKEGWLSKTGPSSSAAYRRRWVTLDLGLVMYSKTPLEAMPKQIVLGDSRQGFDVREDVPPGHRQPSTGSAFTLITPRRRYCFAASTEAERREWIIWLKAVIV